MQNKAGIVRALRKRRGRNDELYAIAKMKLFGVL